MKLFFQTGLFIIGYCLAISDSPDWLFPWPNVAGVLIWAGLMLALRREEEYKEGKQ